MLKTSYIITLLSGIGIFNSCTAILLIQAVVITAINNTDAINNAFFIYILYPQISQSNHYFSTN